MKIWFESISNGIKFYCSLSPLFIALALFFKKEQKEFSPVAFVINQLSIMYVICLISVTLFPLPTPAQAAGLSTYDAQLIPFRFVGDIIKERSLRSIAQVLFNIALTVPLGFLLYFRGNMTPGKAAAITLAASLLIEITQLTGFFFIYSGSYRLFDVDDLFLNTLGGIAGYRIAAALAVKSVRRTPAYILLNQW